MTIEQESASVTAMAPKKSDKPVIGLHPLQQAASRLTDYRDGRSRLKAKDLVGLLLCHGARAWRSAQPEAVIRLNVSATSGSKAVRLRLGQR